jgi:uncharacterized protein (UPF0333 family)
MDSGQISVEYLIILGAVILLVVIPAGIFLTNFALSSMYDTVSEEKANELGKGLTDVAKQVYYLGLYSKKQVTLPVPENVERFYLLNITDENENHYVVIETRERQYYFPSTAPITSDTDDNLVTTADHTSHVDECNTATCSFIAFTGEATLPGRKRFQAETVLQNDRIVVELKPVIS